MTMRIVMLVTLSALVVPFVPLAAQAEEPTRLGEIVVHARPQGPSVRVFLSRSRPSSERAELHDSFTREIVTSTSGSPF